MQITYVINQVEGGGAEVGLRRLIAAAPEHDFTVISLLSHEFEDLQEATIYSLNAPRISPIQLAKASKIISQSDLVIGSLFHAEVLTAVLSTVSRTPFLAWQHSTAYFGHGRRFIRRELIYRMADSVLADSQAVQEELRNLGLPSQAIKTLPLSGVDMNTFTPEAPTLWKRTGIHVGTAGRFVPAKKYDAVLETARRTPEIVYHIAGDGPLNDELRDKGKSLDNVVFHGELSPEKMPRFYSGCDIYFQPSRDEGLCMSAVEAMASGCPIVVSTAGELPRLASVGGRVVREETSRGYARAIRELAEDTDSRSSLGVRGRKKVAKMYSAEALAKRFNDVLADVVR